MALLKSLSVTSGVLMAVFILSLVSAENDLELSPGNDLESMDEIQELLRNVLTLYEMKIGNKIQEGVVPEEENDGNDDDENDDDENPNGCRCYGWKCSCCRFISIRRFRLHKNCCFTVAYLRHHYGILVTLTLGRCTLFTKAISARNPRPVCVAIPRIRRGFSVCIQFSNLYVNVARRSFSGCGWFRARLYCHTVATFNIGCFHRNLLNATQQIEAVELPYLDGPQAPVEGPEPLYLGEVLMEEIKPSYKKKI